MAEQPVWFTRRRPDPGTERPTTERPATELPAKELESDDPYQLTGIRYPVAAGDDPDRETARTLIEEFALQGWGPDRIAGLFADPHAGHAHRIHRRRGAAWLGDLLTEVFGHTRREA